jgi:hypothetical protein
MSWLFSQALVEAFSEANSLDGTPSAPSNTMPTPQAFLSRDKTTDAWSRFPSGMTCEPLTEKRGEELLTWFRAGFLAPTYRPQSKTPKASTEAPADCGAKWQESSVRYDLATSSWKTARCLLSEDLPWSSVTLPKWGMMRNGGIVGACHAGAPHNRKRVWIVGHSERSGLEGYSWHGYDSQGRPDKNRPDEQTGVSILEKPAIEGLEKCLNLERENRGGAQRECPRSSHFSLWGTVGRSGP